MSIFLTEFIIAKTQQKNLKPDYPLVEEHANINYGLFMQWLSMWLLE